jgi:hypothetical protein
VRALRRTNDEMVIWGGFPEEYKELEQRQELKKAHVVELELKRI